MSSSGRLRVRHAGPSAMLKRLSQLLEAPNERTGLEDRFSDERRWERAGP